MNRKQKLIDSLEELNLKHYVVTDSEHDIHIEIDNSEVNFIQASIHDEWEEYTVTFSVAACKKLGYEITDEEYAEECDEQGINFNSLDEVIQTIRQVI